MPSFQEHLRQIRNNWNALRHIVSTECYDWQVNICFYTAFHFLQAYFAKMNFHPANHTQIQQAILKQSKGKGGLNSRVGAAYSNLESLSRIARYITDKNNANSNEAIFADAIDAVTAMRELNAIAVYFSKKYHLSFPKITVTHSQTAAKLKQSLDYFEKGGK